MPQVDVVGLDADDTLWHSEGHFQETERRFLDLLDPWIDETTGSAMLLATERRNLRLFGYGAKGFTLSMIETALTVSDRRIEGPAIQAIVELGKELLAHPIELLDGVAEAIAALDRAHRLVLVTKGDLLHQEAKIAASGLADIFERVEIVSEKDVATYARVCGEMGVQPSSFCMIGNSVRSDIAPVLEMGGAGVHVPYRITWAAEVAVVDANHPRLRRVDSIRDAPEAIAALG